MDLSVGPQANLGQLMSAAGDRGRRITSSSLDSSCQADSTAASQRPSTSGGRRRLTLDMTAALLHRARRGTRSNGVSFAEANKIAFNDTVESMSTGFSDNSSESSASERARAFLESGCGGLSLLDASRLLEQLRSPDTRRTRRGTRRLTAPHADSTLAQLGDDGVAALLHMVDAQLDSFRGSFSDSEDEQSSADETVLEAEQTLISENQETEEGETHGAAQDTENCQMTVEDGSLPNRPGNSVMSNNVCLPKESPIESGSRAALTNISNTTCRADQPTLEATDANRSIVAGSLDQTTSWSGRSSTERGRLCGSPRASMCLSTTMPLLQSTPRRSKVGSELSLRLEASSTTGETSAASKCATNAISVAYEAGDGACSTRTTRRSRRKNGLNENDSSCLRRGPTKVTEQEEEVCNRLQNMSLSSTAMARLADSSALSELEPSTAPCELSELRSTAARDTADLERSALTCDQSELERSSESMTDRRSRGKRCTKRKTKRQSTTKRDKMQIEIDSGQNQLQSSTVSNVSDASAAARQRAKNRRRTVELTAALIEKARSRTSMSGRHSVETLLSSFDSSLGSAQPDEGLGATERARAFLESGCGGLSLLDASRLLEQLRSPDTRRTRRGTRRLTAPHADSTLAQLGDDGVAALLHMIDEQLDSFRESLSDNENETSEESTVLEAEQTLVQDESQAQMEEDVNQQSTPTGTESCAATEEQDSCPPTSEKSSAFHSAIDSSSAARMSGASPGAWLDESRGALAGSLDLTAHSSRSSLRLSTAVPLLQSTPRHSGTGSLISLRLEASSTVAEASNFSRSTRASTMSRASTASRASIASRTSTASRALTTSRMSGAIGPSTGASDISTIHEVVSVAPPVLEGPEGAPVAELSALSEDSVFTLAPSPSPPQEVGGGGATQEKDATDSDATLEGEALEGDGGDVLEEEEMEDVQGVTQEPDEAMEDRSKVSTSSKAHHGLQSSNTLAADSPPSSEPRVLASASILSEPTETLTAASGAPLFPSCSNPGILSATMSSFRAPELRSPGTANSSLTGMSEISLRRPVGRDSTLAPVAAAAACELSLLAGPDASGRRRMTRASRSRLAPPGTSFVDETLHEEGEDEEWEDAKEPEDGEEPGIADGIDRKLDDVEEPKHGEANGNGEQENHGEPRDAEHPGNVEKLEGSMELDNVEEPEDPMEEDESGELQEAEENPQAPDVTENVNSGEDDSEGSGNPQMSPGQVSDVTSTSEFLECSRTAEVKASVSGFSRRVAVGGCRPRDTASPIVTCPGSDQRRATSRIMNTTTNVLEEDTVSAPSGSTSRQMTGRRPRRTNCSVTSNVSRLDGSAMEITCNATGSPNPSGVPLLSSTMREERVGDRSRATASRGSAHSLSSSFGGSGRRLALSDSPVDSPGEVSALHRSTSSKLSRSRLGTSGRRVSARKATGRGSRSRVTVSGGGTRSRDRSGMSAMLDDTMDRTTPVPAASQSRLPLVGRSPSGCSIVAASAASVNRDSRGSSTKTSRSQRANSSRSVRGRTDSSSAAGSRSRSRLQLDNPDDPDSTLVGNDGALSQTPALGGGADLDAADDRRGLLEDSSVSSPGLSFLTRPSAAGDPARLSVAPGDALVASALLDEFSGVLDESDVESEYSEEEDLPRGAEGPPPPPRTAAGRRPTRQERFAELFPDWSDTAGAGPAPGARQGRPKKPGARRTVVRSHVRLFTESDAAHKRWLKGNATGMKVTSDAQAEFAAAMEQYEQLVLAQLTEVLAGRQRVSTGDVLELLRRSGVAPSVADVRRLVRSQLPLEAQTELLRVTEAGGGLYPPVDPLSDV